MTMVREWTQDKLETNNEWSHCSFLERARGGWSKVYWRNLYKYFGGWNNEVWYGTCSGFCEGYTYHGVWNCINKMPEFCHHSGCGGAVGGWLVCASIRFDSTKACFWKRWEIEGVAFLSLLARSMYEQLRFNTAHVRGICRRQNGMNLSILSIFDFFIIRQDSFLPRSLRCWRFHWIDGFAAEMMQQYHNVAVGHVRWHLHFVIIQNYPKLWVKSCYKLNCTSNYISVALPYRFVFHMLVYSCTAKRPPSHHPSLNTIGFKRIGR